MSEKITAMIEEIKGLSVLELSELVHALEDTFGVPAAAVAAPAAGAAAAVEEKTEFDVVMTASAQRRSRSSRKSAASPASASQRLRQWSKAFLPRSRKASPRKTQRLSRLSSRPSAQPSRSSNFLLILLPNRARIASAMRVFHIKTQKHRESEICSHGVLL